MYREIVFPSEQQPIYKFPKEAYGKKVEIIVEEAFIEEDKPIKELLKDFTFSSGGYKFNREEANDYE